MNEYMWKPTSRDKENSELNYASEEDLLHIEDDDPKQKTIKEFKAWATHQEKIRIRLGYMIFLNDKHNDFVDSLKYESPQNRTKILNAFTDAKGYTTKNGLTNLVFRLFCFDRFFDVKKSGKFRSNPHCYATLGDLDFIYRNHTTYQILNFYDVQKFLDSFGGRNKYTRQRKLNDLTEAVTSILQGIRQTTNKHVGIKFYMQPSVSIEYRINPIITFNKKKGTTIETKQSNQTCAAWTPVITNAEIAKNFLIEHPKQFSYNIDSIIEKSKLEKDRHEHNKDVAKANEEAMRKVIQVLTAFKKGKNLKEIEVVCSTETCVEG